MRARSLVRQTLHYLARPHVRPTRGPLGGPVAWAAEELAEEPWRETLTGAQRDEIHAAVRRAAGTGKPLTKLTRRDFPLPTLRHDIRHHVRELRAGRGFVVWRGVPLERWSSREAEIFFWCLGRHLGICGAQNPQGDLLGHVRDQRIDAPDVTVRAYRTRAAIRFHCDAADVVGLFCVRQAKSGGASRIASSVRVHDELWRRHPELASRLFEPFHLDTKAEGGLRFFPIRPCAYDGEVLRTFYHADYFREVARHRDAPRLDARGKALLDAYDRIADEVALDMHLEPGDVQLLSNHTIVHARRGYDDHDAPEARRHLLRLWVSLEPRRALRGQALRARSQVGLLRMLASQRFKQRGAA